MAFAIVLVVLAVLAVAAISDRRARRRGSVIRRSGDRLSRRHEERADLRARQATNHFGRLPEPPERDPRS